MTAKEYLSTAYEIERQVKLIELTIEKLKSQLEYAGISYENTGASHGSGSFDKMPKVIEKVAEYEHKKQERALALIDKRLQIEQSIDALSDANQREVLTRRYILYQRLEGKFNEKNGKYIMGINDHMHYSKSAIYRIHGEALKNIVIPKEWSKLE